MIRDDHKLKASVTNARTDPPIMYVSDIREVASFAPFKPPGGGYAFFHGKGAGRRRSTTPNRSRRRAGQLVAVAIGIVLLLVTPIQARVAQRETVTEHAG